MRLRIFSSTLDGDRENRRASSGTGCGTRWRFAPPNWRGLTTKEAARHSSVSTGEKITCLPGYWPPRYQRSVLVTRLTDRQVQIVVQARHAQD